MSGGNSDYIRVHHASLDQAAGDLAAAVNQTIGIIDDLASRLKPLEAWEGTAQQSYASAKKVWDAAIGDLTGIAAQAQQAVLEANSSYRDVDRRAAGYFDGMSIG